MVMNTPGHSQEVPMPLLSQQDPPAATEAVVEVEAHLEVESSLLHHGGTPHRIAIPNCQGIAPQV